MDRAVVHPGALACLAIVAAASSFAWAQAAPSTQASPAATAPPTTARTAAASPSPADTAESEAVPQPPPPQYRFEELLRVALRDRKLDIAVLPHKILDQELGDGGGAPLSIVGTDQLEWRLRVSRGEGRGRDGAYAHFDLAPPPDHFPDRWSPLQLTQVRSEQSLYLCGSGRVGRTFVTVHYWQEQPANSVRLTVQRSRRAGVGRPLHDFAAADLLELWNRHQREVRMYLAPLLKTLSPGQNLLRPRPGDVYRVFGDIPADGEVTRRVAGILPELEARSPAEREAASAKLEALGAPAVLAVLRMDRSEWTPEQTARLATFVQRQSTLAQPSAWGQDIYFLTDCLDDPDPSVRQSALDSIRAIAGREVDFDLAAGSQARLAAAQEILRTLESETGR